MGKKKSQNPMHPPEDPKACAPFPTGSRKPTPTELENAWGKTLPDILGSGCKILFSGINPGLYTAATANHFARPGNRFWPGIHQAGLTPRLYKPWEQNELPSLGMGITNLVPWATRSAQELTPEQISAGYTQIRQLIKQWQPNWLVVLGITTLRQAMGRKDIREGILNETWDSTRICVLPNPSGLNAHLTLSGFANSLRNIAIHAGLTLFNSKSFE
jgi:TDG/mug DNA glycosylase family protein